MRRATRIAVFAGVMALASSTLLRPVKVEGDSMQPTYQPGDILLTLPMWGTISQGDVVVFEQPSGSQPLIKRVVGLPGHAPFEKDQKSGLLATHTQSWGLARDPAQGLAPEHYFLIGDNPSSSTDSRQFGPVLKNRIHRRVVAKIWSKSSASGG